MRLRRISVVPMIATVLAAQQQQPPPAQAPKPVPPGLPHVNLGDGPFVFDTGEHIKIRVSVVTKGLSHPWSMAFLPDGSMLITERPGRLRIVLDGILDPNPIAGVPQVQAGGTSGLIDIALHANFASNKVVYLNYIKGG